MEFVPSDIPHVSVTADGRWAIGRIAHGVLREATLYRAPLESVGKPDTQWAKICDVTDGIWDFVVHGDDLFLLTHTGAPHFKVIYTSLARPDVEYATTVVPESDHVIGQIATTQDALYVEETDGILGVVKRLSYQGRALEEVQLPFQGSVALAASDERIPGVLLVTGSWVRSSGIDSYDPNTGKIRDTRLQPLGPNDDPQDLISEEVKVKSWDGAMVPLSVVHKRGLKMDGSNPTLLVGYGAYGVIIPPERSSNPNPPQFSRRPLV